MIQDHGEREVARYKRALYLMQFNIVVLQCSAS
jgi:hypothetical protein